MEAFMTTPMCSSLFLFNQAPPFVGLDPSNQGSKFSKAEWASIDHGSNSASDEAALLVEHLEFK